MPFPSEMHQVTVVQWYC